LAFEVDAFLLHFWSETENWNWSSDPGMKDEH
jgi:hypothetical protein